MCHISLSWSDICWNLCGEGPATNCLFLFTKAFIDYHFKLRTPCHCCLEDYVALCSLSVLIIHHLQTTTIHLLTLRPLICFPPGALPCSQCNLRPSRSQLVGIHLQSVWRIAAIRTTVHRQTWGDLAHSLKRCSKVYDDCQRRQMSEFWRRIVWRRTQVGKKSWIAMNHMERVSVSKPELGKFLDTTGQSCDGRFMTIRSCLGRSALCPKMVTACAAYTRACLMACEVPEPSHGLVRWTTEIPLLKKIIGSEKREYIKTILTVGNF